MLKLQNSIGKFELFDYDPIFYMLRSSKVAILHHKSKVDGLIPYSKIDKGKP